MSKQVVATVKWFNTEKGYGFINGPDGDVFIHHRNISPQEEGFKDLNEGDQVKFTQIQSDKGLQAVELLILESTVLC